MNTKTLVKKFMRARTGLNVPIHWSRNSGEGACSVSNESGLVDGFKIPDTLESAGRFVRWHESLHARFTNARWNKRGNARRKEGIPDLAIQVCEDCRIHWVAQGRNGTIAQDELGFVAEDIKSIPALMDDATITPARKLELAGYCLTRTKVLADCASTLVPIDARTLGRNARTLDRNARTHVNAIVGHAGLMQFDAMIKHLKNAAVASISAGIAKGKTQRYEHESRAMDHQTHAEKIWCELFVIPPPKEDGQSTPIPLFSGCGKPDNIGDGAIDSTTASTCHYHDLTTAKGKPAKHQHIIRRRTSEGFRVRPGSIVSFSRGWAGKPFQSQRRAQGGVVMLDCSGSMNPSQATIERILNAAPAATIYGYGGCGIRGAIITLASNGRVCRDVSAMADCFGMAGSNAVDLHAVKHLLASKESPKIFVTDMGFCEGVGDEAIRAAKILTSARIAGQVQVIPSHDDAANLFEQWAKTGQPKFPQAWTEIESDD